MYGNKKTTVPTVDLICRGHCSFYKQNTKEDLACRGYTILETLLFNVPEIADQIVQIQREPFQDRYHHTLRHLLCQTCDFFVDGCDFTDPHGHGDPLPCGGYIVLDKLFQIVPSLSPVILAALVPENLYLVLSSGSFLKKLERPCLYDIRTDELYELDEGGFSFISTCDGTRPMAKSLPDIDFLESCLENDLLKPTLSPEQRHGVTRQSPIPSLRYLELQITKRCNLSCRHCYLGTAQHTDMPLAQIVSTVRMFEEMQGLRLLVSGGEPLLHPDFSAISGPLSQAAVRKVLLTNGSFIRENNYHQWSVFDEIQFSVDGLKNGHDALRGPGAFEQVMKGIEAARQKGMDVSIATMIHRKNLMELEQLAEWINQQNFVEWNLDVPCETGRLSQNNDFIVMPEEGAPFLKLAKGGSYHGSDEPFACGYHLCTVTPAGDVLKCGFFPENRLGSIREGLETCWNRAIHWPLSELECEPCKHLLECKGGCRFRALSPRGKDPVMCALFKTMEAPE